jgi:hypothetical protein
MADLAAGLAAETPEVIELRASNIALQRQLSIAKVKTVALVEAVETAARQAAVTVGRPKAAQVKSDKRRGGEEVALLHSTDWQCGKRTTSYDIETCRTRIERYAQKVAELTEIQRAHHPVRRAVLMLGGDQVEGVGIFPGQAFEVDASLYEQLFAAARITEQLIVDLLATFESVHVVCEWGNHGRLGRKGDHPASDNVDLMLYRIVADRTASDRVTWQYSTDWHQIVEVGNYRALLFHGDEIKSFGGNTPAFGILRKITSWSSGVTAPFQDAYGGHFHTPMTLTLPNGGNVYMTGSPESDNQYAAEFVAARGHPSQRLHYIDPDKGRVAASYIVWLDDA